MLTGANWGLAVKETQPEASASVTELQADLSEGNGHTAVGSTQQDGSPRIDTSQVGSLLSLPGEIWGTIYSKLTTKEDRMNFTHACKAFHDCEDVRCQISKLVIHFPASAYCLRFDVARLTHQMQSFPGLRLRRLDIQGVHDEVARWMRPIVVAVNAAGKDCTELAISGRQGRRLLIWALDLEELCKAAPQLTSLELNAAIEDDIRGLCLLPHLRHLGIKHICFARRLRGLADVLRRCTCLESLALPSSVMEEFAGCSSRPSTPAQQVCCPSLVSLSILNVLAESLLDLQWMLDHVFPKVGHVEIRCIQLLQFDNDRDVDFFCSNPEQFQGVLERIQAGADIFTRGRARLRADGGLILLGSDHTSFDVFGGNESEAFQLYLAAYLALVNGGLSHSSPSVLSLHLGQLVLPPRFWPLCASHFPHVQTLCLAGSELWGLTEYSLAHCITSFPELTHISVCYHNVQDVDVQTAVFMACGMGQIKDSNLVVILHSPGRLDDEKAAKICLETADAQYKECMEFTQDEVKVVCEVAREQCSVCCECEGGYFMHLL